MKLRSIATALVAAAAAVMLTAAPADAREPGPYNVKQLPASAALPKAIKVKGAQVLQVWTWDEYDLINTGYAVFSQTEISKGGRVTGRNIYVQLYSGKGEKQKQLRLVTDGVKGCDLDVVAQFLDGSVSVTDEDTDGINELTFAYDVDCTSDVSPNTRKLLLLEGKDKHALRGTSRVDAGGGDLMGGEFKAEGFKKQPALEALAKARWAELLGK